MNGPGGIDTSVPNMARVYDCLLGGKDNFEADRKLADRLAVADHPRPASPGVLMNYGARQRARDNRAFTVKAVARAAAEGGVTQFLDLGAGLPASPSVHDAARSVFPSARVAYVDSDPVVHLHASALAAGGGLAASSADLTDPRVVLSDPDVLSVIDFSQPVGIIAAAVAQYLEASQMRALTGAFLAAAAPGSWLILSSPRFEDEELFTEISALYSPAPLYNHDPEAFRSWFHGLPLAEPGLTSARRWVRGGCLAGGLPHQAGYVLSAAGIKKRLNPCPQHYRHRDDVSVSSGHSDGDGTWYCPRLEGDDQDHRTLGSQRP